MSPENDAYKKLWDRRYADVEYAYGKLPNLFLKQQLDLLPSGKILLPAEGEGRNAVYAATRGWDVTAFDLSESGKSKATQLAGEHHVSINYLVGSAGELDFKMKSFDVLALIYAHFLADQKNAMLAQLGTYVKKGGLIIFEAFGKGHMPLVRADPNVGGAMDENMLFSRAELRSAFPDFHIHILEESQVELKEGLYHNGTGSVVRFVGQKG